MCGEGGSAEGGSTHGENGSEGAATAQLIQEEGALVQWRSRRLQRFELESSALSQAAHLQLPLRRCLASYQPVPRRISCCSPPPIVVLCDPRCWSADTAVTRQRRVDHLPPLGSTPLSAQRCEVEAGVEFIAPYVARHLLRRLQPRFAYENTAGCIASVGGEPVGGTR